MLFTYQGEKIVELPAIIGMITVGIFVNILVVFAITYLISKPIKLSYEESCSPSYRCASAQGGSLADGKVKLYCLNMDIPNYLQNHKPLYTSNIFEMIEI